MRMSDKPAVVEKLEAFVSQFETLSSIDLLKESMWTLLRMHDSNSTRSDARMVRRILREIRDTIKVFHKFKDVRKVSIFGSARTLPTDPSYIMTEAFANQITRKGFMIITGAGGGIMEAGNKGAMPNMDFGVNIDLPFEQDPNPFIADDPKFINYHYFFTRKLTFVRESDATVLFPGGFGTHDEFFEILTLVQTGRSAPRPIIMVAPKGNDYWKTLEAYIRTELLDRNLISPQDLSLYSRVESAEEAVHEITHFFRIYHSVRYIGTQTVFRLNTVLPEETMEKLQTEFAYLLRDGNFQLATTEETPEDCLNYPDKPRLVFNFNRHNYGGLIELIRFLNDADVKI